MPMRRRYYDPFVQLPELPTPEEQPPAISAVVVEKPGVYLLAEDIVAALRDMAAQVEAGGAPGALAARDTLLGAATSIEQGVSQGTPE